MTHFRTHARRNWWLLAVALLLALLQQLGWTQVGHAASTTVRLVGQLLWPVVRIGWPFLLAVIIAALTTYRRTRGPDPQRSEVARRRTLAVALRIGVAVVGVGFVLLVVTAVPPLFVHDTSLEGLRAQNEVRATLLQGLGGTAVLTGVYFTYRQLATGRMQLRAAEQGQITERFTRAVNQLGHQQLDIRLGGIYALERIVWDSPADRAAISEILGAYVRGHAAWPPSEPGQDRAAEPPKQPAASLQVRAADIHAVMTVLGRNAFPAGRAAFPPMKQGFGVDLRATDLRSADFGGAHLEGANLGDAHLERSMLRGTHLEEAFLNRAHLKKAFLFAAHLEGADLGGAHLEGANLGSARLEKAFLGGAYLEGANLSGAHMEGAVLDSARLKGSDLRGTQLGRAFLTGTDLKGADLTAADLKGADLTGAHLEGANLRGADMEYARLERTRLQGAKANAITVWPGDFVLRATGVIFDDDESG